MRQFPKWGIWAGLGILIVSGLLVVQFGKKPANHVVNAAEKKSESTFGQQTVNFAKSENPALMMPELTVPIAQHVQAGRPFHYKNQVAVLMYHHIDPTLNNRDTITPQRFADDLDTLMADKINFITLDQFRSFMQGGAVPDNAALITFDDGYESYYKYAYPALKARGIGGVSFVITGDLSKKAIVYTPHMTAAEMKFMTTDDPNMEVQAHTDSLHYKVDRNHDALTGFIKVKGVFETKQQYLDRIHKDTETCVNKLKSLNAHEIDSFAYPYGLSNKPAIQALEQNGIKYAFTTKPGIATQNTNHMLIPRVNGGAPTITPQMLHDAIEKVAIQS